MVLEQNIKIKWSSKNKKHFENLGYHFSGIGEEFDVKVKDLMPNQNVNILLKCDYCGAIYNRGWIKYYKHYLNPTFDLCNNCENRVFWDNNTKQLSTWDLCVLNYCKRHNYTLVTDLNEIVNRESRISYICPKHGIKETSARMAKDNCICYDCSRPIAFIQYRERTKESRRDSLYNKCLDFAKESGYVLITPKNEFKVSSDLIEYECPIHGIQTMTAGNFAIKRHCHKCLNEMNRQNNKMSIEEVKKRIENCHGVLLNPEEYVNQSVRNLKILCPECGESFITSLISFTQHGGQVCSNCESNESMGEHIIRWYLEERNIFFEQEKWFEDCRDERPLPFDFYLKDKNIIIEFDGYQHYYQTDYFRYKLEQIQYHDLIKSQYCERMGIHLIRIPYWHMKNISKILDKELNIPHKDIV